MKSLRSQSGSVVAFVLIGLVMVGILSTLAYGTYYQVARGTQDTVVRSHSAMLLTQAAYTLAAEASDGDADGVAEPTAGLIAHQTGDGWNIPASSGAPKQDAWGSAIKYCPWDNGSVNASANRFTGANPELQSSVQLALVSPGPDKSFNTTCAQAGLNTANGDDGIRVLTLAQMNRGVAGTYAPDLGPVDTASCAGHARGTLARDSADALFMCTGAATWKKIGG